MYITFLKNFRKKNKEISDMPARAQEILNYFNVNYLSSGVPIVEILIKLGFQIYQSDLKPEGLSAYIAVDPEFREVYGSNKITCVHINNSIGHKRFALAHVLGHYLFDFDETVNVSYYNTYFPKKHSEKFEEQRANEFAANLLMPEKDFRREYVKCGKLQSKADIVNELSQIFLVSSDHILRRFNGLGIDGFDTEKEL